MCFPICPSHHPLPVLPLPPVFPHFSQAKAACTLGPLALAPPLSSYAYTPLPARSASGPESESESGSGSGAEAGPSGRGPALGLAGAHQRDNAALAVALCRAAGRALPSFLAERVVGGAAISPGLQGAMEADEQLLSRGEGPAREAGVLCARRLDRGRRPSCGSREVIPSRASVRLLLLLARAPCAKEKGPAGAHVFLCSCSQHSCAAGILPPSYVSGLRSAYWPGERASDRLSACLLNLSGCQERNCPVSLTPSSPSPPLCLLWHLLFVTATFLSLSPLRPVPDRARRRARRPRLTRPRGRPPLAQPHLLPRRGTHAGPREPPSSLPPIRLPSRAAPSAGSIRSAHLQPASRAPASRHGDNSSASPILRARPP